MTDRSMKIFINHPQTICIHPVKWRLKIPSRLRGVRRQHTRPTTPPNAPLPREVPMTDRFMKNYINHPQTTCTHPVKWRLEIPSRFGGVRGQRFPPDKRVTDRHALKQRCTHQKCIIFIFFYFYDKSLG